MNELNIKKSDDFADKMIEVLNNGVLVLMMSIGHRTGLFEALKDMPASTEAQIANAAELDEGCVREWLKAMVVGGIVECDVEKKLFSLPREHALWLTKESTTENIAVLAQYTLVLGTIEDKIIEWFKKGGGMDYLEYSHFHRLWLKIAVKQLWRK